MPKTKAAEKKIQALLKSQCASCPFQDQKEPDQELLPAEILIITEKRLYKWGQIVDKYAIHHAFLSECTPPGTIVDKKTKYCCLGRKLDLILGLRPKLVIAIGRDVYKELEALFGYTVPKRAQIGIQLLPTRYMGYDFWMLVLPDYDVKTNLMKYRHLIDHAMVTPPVVQEGNLDGVEFCMTMAEIKAAFAYLRKAKRVAIDIETKGLRPYFKLSKILTIALSDGTRTFVFPIRHRETPTGYPWHLVLSELAELSKLVPLIAHNLVFELEWLGKFMGVKFLYHNLHHDTMAQTYLLSSQNRKSLNDCVRREMGFDLKSLSDIDVANLDNEDINKVMSYNGLDAKYTARLWDIFDQQITEQDLQDAYILQLQRIPAIALMQLLGLKPNIDFIQEESIQPAIDLARLQAEFVAYPEVQHQISKYGECKVLSNPALNKLFHEEFGVPSYQRSFNEEYMATVQHPIAKTILELRKVNKFLSTYLLPFNDQIEGAPGPDGIPKRGGYSLYEDGLIHGQFNSMVTITGRLSSNGPNLQNFPARGGKKYLRDVVDAPPGYIMVAIDFGQIEARLIAAFSGDPVLLAACGGDFHMEWALELMKALPGFFVEDENDPAQVKAFRGLVKNQFVFPSFYGSSRTNVCLNLGVPEKWFSKIMPVFAKFWAKYKVVKQWQSALQSELNNNGFISSPFGRKYWAPLKWTELINYPIQGAASDVVVTAMAKLAKMAILNDIIDLCPRINIHDDLTFYIQEDALEDLMPIILDTMLDVEAYSTGEKAWLPVPLTVEVSIGYTWGHLEPLGTFSSADWKGELAAA